MSVRKLYNIPRDGGTSLVTVSAGGTFRKNPSRKVCQLEDN